MQLHYVVGVEPGKEIKFVVVAEEHAIALRNTRLLETNLMLTCFVFR